jgi:quercetin dioxygenase-like cupin family protein
MLKIVRLEDIEATPGHGVNMIHRELMGKDSGAKFTVVYNILKEGGKGPYPPHKHEYEHCIYIVGGLGRITSGGETRVVQAGDFIFIPSNELHSNENISNEELHFMGFNM